MARPGCKTIFIERIAWRHSWCGPGVGRTLEYQIAAPAVQESLDKFTPPSASPNVETRVQISAAQKKGTEASVAKLRGEEQNPERKMSEAREQKQKAFEVKSMFAELDGHKPCRTILP